MKDLAFMVEGKRDAMQIVNMYLITVIFCFKIKQFKIVFNIYILLRDVSDISLNFGRAYLFLPVQYQKARSPCILLNKL